MSIKQQAPTALARAPNAALAESAVDEGEDYALLGNAAQQEKLKAALGDGGGDPAGGGGAAGGDGGSAPGGMPSDLPFRAEMEAAFGTSFGDVAVFVNDSDAAELSANAFAEGNRIHFAMGRSEIDEELVAHELTHIVQKRGGAAQPSAVQADSAVSKPGDASEVEAREVAANVASGRAAGPIAAAPSAPIQRDAAAPDAATPAFEDKTEEGFAFRVYPDDHKGAILDVGDKWAVRASGLAKAVADRKLVHAATTEILSAAKLASTVDFHKAVHASVGKLAPEIRGKLFRYRPLITDAIWQGSPQRLIDLANTVDPLAILVQGLSLGKVKGQKPGQVVADWAKAYPADGPRAVQSAAVQGWLATLDDVEKTGCIELLMNGGVLSDTPLARLRRALVAKDNVLFLGAWGDVIGDQKALDKLQNDASFLSDVQSNLGESTYQTVLQVLVTGGAPKKNLSHDLTAEELDAVEGQARLSAKKLAAELDDWNVDEADVLAFLTEYATNVANLLKAADESDEAKEALAAKKSKSRKVLERVYADLYQRNLVEDVGKGLSGDKEHASAMALLGVSGGGGGMFAVMGDTLGPPKMDDDGAASDEAPPADPPKNLTPDEKNELVDFLASGHLKKIHDELTSSWVTNSKITDLMREYDVKCFAVVPDPSDGADTKGKEAAGWRRAEAKQLLREEYKDAYGTELQSDMKNGMSGDQLTWATNYTKGDKFVSDDEKKVYPAKLEGDELEQVKGVARPHAATLNKEMSSVVYVSDGKVPQLLNAAKEAIKTAIKPHDPSDENRKRWASKTNEGMAVFKKEYDASFGSIVKAIHDHVQNDADRRTALALIGDRADANEKLGVVDAIAGDDVAYGEELKKCIGLIVPIAEAIAKETFATMIGSIPEVKRHVGDFGKIQNTFQHLRGNPKFLANGGFLKLLETAFLPVGGSLRMAIASLPVPAEAEKILGDLGYTGGLGAATVPRDADLEAAKAGETDAGKKQALEDQIVTKQAITPWAKKAWTAIQAYGQQAKQGYKVSWGGIESNFSGARSAASSPKLDAAAVQATIEKVYAEVNGITVPAHLAIAIPADQLAAIVPLTGHQGPVTAKAVPTVKEAMDSKLEATDPALQFDPLKCTPGFTIEAAKARAVDVHDQLDKGEVRKASALLAGEGKKEENRIVLELFRRIYGYDVKHKLKEKLGSDEAEIDRIVTMAKTGAQKSFVQQVKGKLATESLTVLMTMLANASDDDKRSVLNDGALMFEMRKKFGAKSYDRIYRTLTGELTAADILRDHDARKEWWAFGFGTDKEGAEKSLKEFFAVLRAKLLAGKPKVNKDDKAAVKAQTANIDAAMKKKALAVFADPDCQEMLNAEFSGDELLQMKQILLGAGEQTATDKVETDMEGLNLTTPAAIFDNLKAMTDEERKEKRNDPIFVAKLSKNLSGDDLQKALDILHADKGKESEADLHGAINDSSINVDEDKIFETVTKMSHAELVALANDPVRLAKIRVALDKNEKERDLFDKLIADAKKLGDAKTAAPGQPMSEDEKKQRKDTLVIKHKYGLIRAIYSGKEKALAAAQAVYTEKGEVAPDPKNPDATEQLFGLPQRRLILADVEKVLNDEYGSDLEFTGVIRAAIMAQKDPSAYRLAKGIAGVNNDDAIKGAIDGVSDDTLATEWANVLKPGEKSGSFKGVYDAYKADRNNVAARHAFIDFRLDLAGDFLTVLKQTGDWHDEFSSAGDKELLGLKGQVRAKIWKLSKETLAKALNVDTSTPEGKLDADLLTNDDRIIRSEMEQKKDEVNQQLGQSSVIDSLTKTDEALEDANHDLLGEKGKATDSTEKGVVGTIDDEEKEAIKAKTDALGVTEAEYKAAKSTASDVMKWAAMAVITVVATLLTGPGGPTLLAAMLTAAAQAGTAAVIDEAVHGKDYELVQEGVKKVVIDTATAFVTFGAGKLLDGAAEKYKAVSQLKDKYKAYTAWKEAIEKNASKSFEGAAWAGALAGGEKMLGSMSDAAVAGIDPSVWKYGWNEGFTHTGKTIAAAVEKMPADVGKEMVKTIVKAGGKAAGQKIGLKDKDEPDTLPGSEDATTAPPTDPGKPTLGGALKKGASEALAPKKLAEAAYDQTIDTATDKVLSGDVGKASSWQGDMAGTFMKDFAKGRADELVKGTTKAYKKQKDAHAVAKRVAEFGAVGLPIDEMPLALQHYKAYLADELEKENVKTGLESGEAALLGMSPQKWVKQVWEKRVKQVDEQVGGVSDSPLFGGDLKAAYKKYVLGSPADFDKRVALPWAEFVAEHEAGQKQVAAIKASSQYAALSAGDKKFYDAYLADPSNLRDYTKKGAAADGAIDVRTPDGQKALAETLAATKKRMVAVLAADVTKDWKPEDKADFESLVVAGTILDPADVEGSKKRIADAAKAFQDAKPGAGPTPAPAPAAAP